MKGFRLVSLNEVADRRIEDLLKQKDHKLVRRFYDVSKLTDKPSTVSIKFRHKGMEIMRENDVKVLSMRFLPGCKEGRDYIFEAIE